MSTRISELFNDSDKLSEPLRADLDISLPFVDHPELISYMADFGALNKDNPFSVNQDEAGAVQKEADVKDPLDVILHSPDPYYIVGKNEDGTDKKHHSKAEKKLAKFCVTDGEISLRDWMKMKLSVDSWENDARYKGLPRILLAILIENNDEKVQLVNEFIKTIKPYTMKTRVKSESVGLPFSSLRNAFGGGSSYFEGEFDDFTICNWTRMLCMARKYPELINLQEETQNYILHHLLKFDGRHFDDAIMHTQNIVLKWMAHQVGFSVTDNAIRNSENHLLMINGSAYIKNAMINSAANLGSELEIKLGRFLDNLYQKGLSEFNSIPYAGYTVEALLNLHDFAQEPVKTKATKVLNKIFYDYIIHSTNDGKNLRPFARQAKKLMNQNYNIDDAVRAFLTPWLGLDCNFYQEKDTSRNSCFAFTGITTSYKLPEAIYDLAMNKQKGYLALTGQPHGNAEISYKNWYGESTAAGDIKRKQYLLSGGGVTGEPHIEQSVLTSMFGSFYSNRSIVDNAQMRVNRHAGEVISRNPVLILNGTEGPSTLEESIYLGTENAINQGPGFDSKGHNNSGIYFDMLIGPYPVHVPSNIMKTGLKPESQDPTACLWTLYELDTELRVAVFDGLLPMNNHNDERQVGLVLVLPGMQANPQQLINTIANENQDRHRVGRQLKFPDNCGSVMRGKTVTFNPYSALDRYAICGCGDGIGNVSTEEAVELSLSVSERTFYPMAMRDNSGHSKGWSACSTIQYEPSQQPLSHLEPQNTSYHFMAMTKLESALKNDALISSEPYML